MSWGITAMAGMAVLGGVQADQQQRAQKKRNLAAAEHNRYSNWTGRTMNQSFDAPSTFGGALQGGLTGASMAQSFGGFGGWGGGASSGKDAMMYKSGVDHAGGGTSALGGNLGGPRDGYGSFISQGNKRTLFGR